MFVKLKQTLTKIKKGIEKMLGLGTKDEAKKKQNDSTKKDESSAADEAKAMLAKMEAKKESGDCPFC